MDLYEYGDPYVDWNEENSAKETPEMPDFNIEELKTKVQNLLVSTYDFSIDDAEESVNDSLKEHDDMWNENADPNELAKFLASDEAD